MFWYTFWYNKRQTNKQKQKQNKKHSMGPTYPHFAFQEIFSSHSWMQYKQKCHNKKATEKQFAKLRLTESLFHCMTFQIQLVLNAKAWIFKTNNGQETTNQITTTHFHVLLAPGSIFSGKLARKKKKRRNSIYKSKTYCSNKYDWNVIGKTSMCTSICNKKKKKF